MRVHSATLLLYLTVVITDATNTLAFAPNSSNRFIRTMAPATKRANAAQLLATQSYLDTLSSETTKERKGTAVPSFDRNTLVLDNDTSSAAKESETASSRRKDDDASVLTFSPMHDLPPDTASTTAKNTEDSIAEELMTGVNNQNEFVLSEPTVGISNDDSNDGSVSPQKSAAPFVNDGVFSWMSSFLDAWGVKPGKSIYYGPIPGAVDESKALSKEEAARRRKEATDNLTNIHMDERDRRGVAGDIFLKLTVLYAAVSSLTLDDGTWTGHLARFAVVVPLFLGIGYKKSADTGLCNVAQSGLWDIDGTGLQRIEDDDLSNRLLAKVNAINAENLLFAVSASAAFATLSKDITAPLAGFAVLFGGLYLLNGKLPK